jgi:hypothetical protein
MRRSRRPERAVAGREGDRRAEAGAVRLRSQQLTLGAIERGLTRGVELQVAPDGQCRQQVGALPARAEGDAVGVAAVERPPLVGPLELAAAQAAEQLRLAQSKHGQVHLAVAVDVDGIGALDAGEVGRPVGQLRERQVAAHSAVVAVQGRGVGAAGQVNVGAAVVVAVEHGHSAADVVAGVAVIRMVQAGARRLVDEMGSGDAGFVLLADVPEPVPESGQAHDGEDHGAADQSPEPAVGRQSAAHWIPPL